MSSIFIMISCYKDSDKNKYNEARSIILEAENLVFQTYNSEFNSTDTIAVKMNILELYEKVEEYFMFTGVLGSIDKIGYYNFYLKAVKNDTTIDLSCLYKYYPEAEMLFLPSNIGMNFYSFEVSLKKYEDYLLDTSTLKKAYAALIKIKSGNEILFENEELFKNYLDAIDDKKFSSDVIYRAPIISFSHTFLIEKYLRKREF